MARFLTPLERDIWQKFHAQLQPQPKDVYFEVPVLKLAPGARYIQKNSENWWERITALRIDVLWQTDLGYQLAEIEETLTMESIGQALSYRELWNELNPGVPIEKAWVITAGDDPRLHAGLKAANITHHLINLLSSQ